MIREQFEYASEYHYNASRPKRRPRAGIASAVCFAVVGITLWWLCR